MVDRSGLLVSLLAFAALAVLVATYRLATPALAWVRRTVPQWLALATALGLVVFLAGFAVGRYR